MPNSGLSESQRALRSGRAVASAAAVYVGAPHPYATRDPVDVHPAQPEKLTLS